MIATNASVTYICNNCKIPYTSNYIPEKDVSKILDSIDVTRLCGICGRAMHVSSVIFKVLENNYGDDLCGSWRCPIHEAFVYYPGQLKKAAQDDLQVVTTGHTMCGRYYKIIATKYPWKCPLCNIPLEYITDKYEQVHHS